MSTLEGWVYAGTDWNDHANFIIQGFDPGVAPKRWQWISGADSDGALPAEEAHYDNAEMTVRVRIAPQANMDAALAKIGTLVQSLQEAEKQPLGSAGTWTPAGSTKSLTAYIVGGEVTGVPQALTGDDAGWFIKNPAPVVTMKLYRRPFLYGPEVTNAATVTADTNPVQTLTLASVTGDVPAEARLIVTDAATQSRRHVEWGLQQRYYDAATSLIVDSDNMVTTGFAGVQAVLSGAYDPNASGNNVISTALLNSLQAVAGTGNLGHVGVFRVKARVSANTTAMARLSWQEGDGPFRTNGYAVPVVNGWNEIDLGTISIPATTLGTQKWSGRVEAYSTAVVGTTDNFYLDYLVLIPAAEGYGKGRGIFTYSPGVVNAHDEFTSIVAGTALTTRTAPAGGAWATSGATTDFTAADAPLAADETETRATTADSAGGRFAILGTTNYTDTEVAVSFYRTATPGNSSAYQGVVCRWTDASNHLRIVSDEFGAQNAGGVHIVKVVAGTPTEIATLYETLPATLATWYRLRVTVYASGAGVVYLLDANGATLGSVSFKDSVLATGGTLATGKPGFVDYNASGTAITRYYDNFSHATPPAEPIVVYSGRVAEIRADTAIRQDSTGTYYGTMSSYRGSRFYVPASGSAGRTSRVLVKLRRNDIDTSQDDQIADSTTVAINYTPRFLVAPR